MQFADELKSYVTSLENAPTNYGVAVAALIFNENGELLLQERGEKVRSEPGTLEGIGGAVDEGETDLYETLQREIKEEIGDVEVSIETLLTVIIRPSTKDLNFWWVLPIYLCRLISGVPTIQEPDKCSKLFFTKLEDISEDRLSTYQQEIMQRYKEKYDTEPFYKDQK
ncbi:MAG: NUDIX hydrolase [Patescibacteria group bacterium]